MTTPVRLQLSRARGFRLQEHSLATNGLPAVKVDRTTKYGNPWSAKQHNGRWFLASKSKLVELCRDREHALKLALVAFDQALRLGSLPFTAAEAREVFSKANPSCWCKPGARCHGDLLLAIANEKP